MEIMDILTLNAKEFGEWILDNLKPGDSVAFALDVDRWHSPEEDGRTYENWWFVKVIDVDPGYNSMVILFDYCGGGYPYAVAIDGDDDLTIESIDCYFRRINDMYNETEKINIDLNTLSKGGNNNE